MEPNQPAVAVASKWKQPERAPADEWVHNTQDIHTVQYYLATRKNMNMTLKNMLCREKPVIKDHILWSYLYEIPNIGKSI